MYADNSSFPLSLQSGYLHGLIEDLDYFSCPSGLKVMISVPYYVLDR